MLSTIFKVVLVTILFSNANSKGSPWDWQSVNAKYPREHPGHGSPHLRHQGGGGGHGTPITLEINSNVTVFVGDTAQLPCRVRNLGEYTVSWLRGRDTSVLSVGHHTFSSDQRFSVVQVPRPRLSATDWNLEIKSVTFKDSGWYDCQVNTEPKISNKSYLTVEEPGPWKTQNVKGSGVKLDASLQDSPVQQRQVIPEIQEFLQPRGAPKATISGPSMVRLPPGDSLSLDCTVARLASPPKSLYWTHKGSVITPKSKPGVSIESEKLAGVSQSHLVVVNLRPEDEGTYSCVTDVSNPASIELIIDGRGPKIGGHRLGPIALAQTSHDEDDPDSVDVLEDDEIKFKLQVERRLAALERKYAHLVREIQALHGDTDGAEALASRVSRGTAPVSTVILISFVLSIVHIVSGHLADIT